MKKSISTILVATVALFGVSAAIAGEPSAKPATEQTDIKAQLKDLKKAAGAGEISAKEYNLRKQALMEMQRDQQVGDAGK